jgi:ATP-binding cassette subfamily B protein
VGQVYYNILFLGNLFEFLDLRASIRDPANPRALPAGPRAHEVRFDAVSFRYPGSERAALEHLDVAVAPGEIAAIVGANGAGKSTLLKLLCRFHDPEAGVVSIGGIDLRELALRELRQSITVLFQEPVRYHASVAENIALQALKASASRAQVECAARAAGAEDLIGRLPRGYDTLLGTRFDGGVELSVGEWQRIALARAFLRPSPILVLDEPTSAMDSWAEADWLARFRALAAHRTAIIVTHRFTTAMQADVIHVMEAGRVVESGSHGQLLDLGGSYARSWRSQMGAGGARRGLG